MLNYLLQQVLSDDFCLEKINILQHSFKVNINCGTCMQSSRQDTGHDFLSNLTEQTNK
jgi:hypothetical protein